MIWLKIILQVIVGLAAFVTAKLDYEWHDKRKNKFKKARNLVFIVTIFTLFISVVITYADEKSQTKEKKALIDSLSSIKQIGLQLKDQIEPIINLAREKYPDLPIGRALEKLKLEIDSLQEKVSSLNSIELIRKKNEQKLAMLKKTKPKVVFDLKIKNEKLWLIIKFLNEVPIEFRPYLSDIKNEQGQTFKKPGNRVFVEYLKADPDNGVSSFDFFNLTGYDFPKNNTYLFRVFVYYKSIYASVDDSNLKEETEEMYYILNPIDMTLKPYKN